MRLLSGVKSSSEAAEIRGDRIEITAGDDARFKGGKTQFTKHIDGSTLVASYEPQVGFAETENAESILFAETDLTRDIVAQYSSHECFVIGETEADYQRLTARLGALGCTVESILWWHPDTSLPLVREELHVQYRLDDGVFRAVGKIALNYLARVAGSEFCLITELNPFRRFIRYGEGDWRSFIRISQELLLFDERRTGVRQTRGHLLVVEWREGADAPTASVKLFNDIHYHVRFAPRVNAIWREIRSGHHFNIKKHTIEPIKIVAFQL
jgi:hypothetical protein